MRYIVILICLSFSAGAGVITSVTCQADSGPAVVAESSCYQDASGEYGPRFAAADASASLTLPAAPGDFVQAAIHFKLETFDHPLFFSRADASAAMEFLFTSGGPVRSGLIEWDFWDGHGTTTVNFGDRSITCVFPNSFDMPSCSGLPGGPILPITLGEPFALHMSRTAFTTNHPLVGSVDDASVFKFRLFELDGVTPVAVLQAVPEPALTLLCGLALALAAAVRRRVR